MRFYEKYDKTSENRLPQRAFYIPEGEAVYNLLNGEWRFFYHQNADAIDCEGVIKKWDKVNVPSTWQNTGYENPNYTNINYPFPVDPPYVPQENAVSIYEKWYWFQARPAYRKTRYLALDQAHSLTPV